MPATDIPFKPKNRINMEYLRQQGDSSFDYMHISWNRINPVTSTAHVLSHQIT